MQLLGISIICLGFLLSTYTNGLPSKDNERVAHPRLLMPRCPQVADSSDSSEIHTADVPKYEINHLMRNLKAARGSGSTTTDLLVDTFGGSK